jgi:hypothetical protein
MGTVDTTYNDPAVAGAIERDARELLGYVAVTVGFAALGAYLGRDLSGGTGLLLFIAAFAAIFGLHSQLQGAANISRSGCCSGWACCSDCRSPR